MDTVVYNINRITSLIITAVHKILFSLAVFYIFCILYIQYIFTRVRGKECVCAWVAAKKSPYSSLTYKGRV